MARSPGRPRLPNETLKLHGSRLAERREAESPSFKNGMGSCPEWLSAEAKAEWRRLVKEIESVGWMGRKPDRAALTCLCESFGDFQQLLRAIKDALSLNDGEYDGPLMQLVRLKNAAAERVVKYAAEFGFTPASRSKVVKPSKATNDPNSITGFARKRDVS